MGRQYFDLTGRSALVTGAAGGIGSAVSAALADAGAAHPLEIQLAQTLAAGHAVTGVTGAEVDDMNAAHAQEHWTVTQVKALDLLRRNSEAAAGVVDEALALPVRPKVIWMQLGVRNDAAAAEAEAAGLQVVMNRCAKIEYGRLSGEIGWAGVNVGILSSRRPLLSGRGVQDHLIPEK